MFANLICWIIALALILSESKDFETLCIKLCLAMGFILLGAIHKAVDFYREIHLINIKEN